MSHAWKQHLMMIPGVGVSLLPKLACPLCWPAYAGLMSSVGLGFLISTRYLLPLTAIFLVFALAALIFRAKHRNGYGPFVLGIVSAVSVVTGKFVFESSLTMYAAVTLLMTASVWNAWPLRGKVVNDCCAGNQQLERR